MFETLAAWVAPAATMIAAILTASNLGARVTGAGFIVFAVGSLAWCLVAVSTDQSNLLWTNGFLVLVNLVGVWRWLGRQARFDEGGRAAAAASGGRAAATLFPGSSLIGASVTGADDVSLGQVVDVMMSCDSLAVSYVVISDGGVGGVGEKLYGLAADEVTVRDAALETRVTQRDLERRAVLAADDWPASLARAHLGL